MKSLAGFHRVGSRACPLLKSWNQTSHLSATIVHNTHQFTAPRLALVPLAQSVRVPLKTARKSPLTFSRTSTEWTPRSRYLLRCPHRSRECKPNHVSSFSFSFRLQLKVENVVRTKYFASGDTTPAPFSGKINIGSYRVILPSDLEQVDIPLLLCTYRNSRVAFELQCVLSYSLSATRQGEFNRT